MLPELELTRAPLPSAPASPAATVVARLRALGAWSPRNPALRAVLAGAALAALVGAGFAIRAAGIRIAPLAAGAGPGRLPLGLALAAVVGAALLSPARRPSLLLAVSAVALSYVLGMKALLVGAYALLVGALARSPLPLAWQVTIALAAWAALPVCRWTLPTLPLGGPLVLFMVWVQLAYSAVYLLVEHARARRKPSLVSSLFYLTALPRLLHPFYQPIAPSQLERSATPAVDLRMLASAVALGVYAMLLQGPMAFLFRHVGAEQPFYVACASVVAWGYCAFAHNIFLAVSLFRLMGYDLPSGMRRPFLSESFADFFTRWNTYVRDAVLSLFYLPLFLRFRRWLPLRGAVIAAGYLAILLGSFLLNDLLVPVASAPDWRRALARELRPDYVLFLVATWTGIILPSALAAGNRERSRLPRWVRVPRFLLQYAAIVVAFWVLFST